MVRVGDGGGTRSSVVGDRVRHRHRSPSWSAVGALAVVVGDGGCRGEPRFNSSWWRWDGTHHDHGPGRGMPDGLPRTVKDTHVRGARITIYGIMNAIDNDSNTDMHTYDSKFTLRSMSCAP